MVDESEKNAMMFIKEVHELLKIFFERNIGIGLPSVDCMNNLP